MLGLGLLFSNSCRKSDNSQYFYDPAKDTSAPKINISVPTMNQLFNYGDDIHIVGTVSDLQTTLVAGKLSTLAIKLDELKNTDSVYLNTLLYRTPLVDAKDSYLFNEKILILSGANPTLCRLEVTATDYASKITKDTVYFKIQ